MWIPYAVVAAALVIVGGIGGKATDTGPWYRGLVKPSWNPPDWVFPVAWTSIYLLIIYSVGSAWNLAEQEQKTLILWIVGVNFVLNLLWSVIFFSMRNPKLALIEVFLLWLSIVAMILLLMQISSLSALLLLPYLLWVSVASVLNWRIVQLNPELNQGVSA